MAAEHVPFVLAAVGTDDVVIGGVTGLLALLFRYFFQELRRKDRGVWELIEDRDRTIAELRQQLHECEGRYDRLRESIEQMGH